MIQKCVGLQNEQKCVPFKYNLVLDSLPGIRFIIYQSQSVWCDGQNFLHLFPARHMELSLPCHKLMKHIPAKDKPRGSSEIYMQKDHKTRKAERRQLGPKYLTVTEFE